MLRRSAAVSVFAFACVLASASGCAGPSSATSEADVTAEDLPVYGGELDAKIEEIATLWNDENIMQGRATVLAVDVGRGSGASVPALVGAAKDALSAYAERDEMELDGEVRETVEPTNDALTQRVGHVAAVDGFVYADSEENVAPKVEEVRSLVELVGPSKEVTAVTLEAKGTIPWAESEDGYRATTFVFVNRVTGKGVAFFVREGWI